MSKMVCLQTNFHDKTPYTIMFGPDKCGNDHKVTTVIYSIATMLFGTSLNNRRLLLNVELCYVFRSFRACVLR